jgi:MYXO-CTERM domain-containing protein
MNPFPLINRRSFAAASAFAGMLLASAYGGAFNFSYTFRSGDFATGSFDGTQNGNLITEISNVTLAINGSSITPVFSYSWTLPLPATNSLENGGVVVSVDGTQNNFIFMDSEWINGGSHYSAYFFSKSSPAAFGYPKYAEAGLTKSPYRLAGGENSTADGPQNATWLVTKTSVSSVGDASSTMAMLFSALAGLALLRRRFTPARQSRSVRGE